MRSISLVVVACVVFVCLVHADFQDQLVVDRDIFHLRNVNESDPNATAIFGSGADGGSPHSTGTDSSAGETTPPGSSIADESGSGSTSGTSTGTDSDPGSTPQPGSCPTPVERCCTRVMNNPRATLRVDTNTPGATLTSITAWNDAPGGAPLLPADGGPISHPEVSVGAPGAMSWCLVGQPLPGVAMSGYAGMSLACPTRGEILTFSFSGLLDPASPPGRLSVRLCIVAASDAGGPPPQAKIWIQRDEMSNSTSR
jgi:hypothetical protein